MSELDFLEEGKSAPKFAVGQVVAFSNMKGEAVFRIQRRYWNDGWFYFWNRKNAASEYMLRALTLEEKG